MIDNSRAIVHSAFQGEIICCRTEEEAAAVNMADGVLRGVQSASSDDLRRAARILQSHGYAEAAATVEGLQLKALATEYRASYAFSKR